MLDFALRLLFALFLLANLNIPGSANFFGELLSLVAAFSISTFYAAFFLLTSFMSSLLWFLILNRKLACCSHYSICVNPMLVLVWLAGIIFYHGVYFFTTAVLLITLTSAAIMVPTSSTNRSFAGAMLYAALSNHISYYISHSC